MRLAARSPRRKIASSARSISISASTLSERRAAMDVARERRRRRACRSAADRAFDRAEALGRAPAGVRATAPRISRTRRRRTIHHWLSATEIGERFGATQHDIDAVSGWLRSQGLNVDAVSNSRTRIRFSGTAAAVARAFATAMRLLRRRRRESHRECDRCGNPGRVRRCGRVGARPHGRALPPGAAHDGADPERSRIDAARGERIARSGSTSCVIQHFPVRLRGDLQLQSALQPGHQGRGQTIAIVGRSRVYQPTSISSSRWPDRCREHADDDHAADRHRSRPAR